MRHRLRLIALAGVVAASGLMVSAVPAAAGVPCPYTYCGNTSTLRGGSTLQSGDWITSGNGVFSLTMQGDSNLVLRDKAYVPHWSSGTSSRPNGAWLAMQTDGNLVIYRAGGTCYCGADAYWASGTNGWSGAYVVMQTDGNLVIYSSSGFAVWASNTATYTTSMLATETAYGKPDNGTSVGSRAAGSTVHIWCQTNVGADTGHGGYSVPGNFTWDNLAEGGWVADWYVNTPAVYGDGYSSGVRRCQRNGPLTVTSTVHSWLSSYPGQPGQAWVVPGNNHTVGPLFNDSGDYWQSVRAESTSSALANGACQDLVLANSNFFWLFDPGKPDYAKILNNVDTWGPDSGGGTDVFNNVTYPGYGRLWLTSNPEVGDIVVFGHVQHWTPNGHVASVIRVDSDGFVIAEFNFFQNGGGKGILDFRKVTFAYNPNHPDDPIAFIR